METQHPSKVYKYYAPNEYNKDALINSYFWFAKRKYQNDPYDCFSEIVVESKALKCYPYFQQFNKSGYANLLDQFGICCFTENATNRQMWAHYADSFKGWCLEFECDSKSQNVVDAIYATRDLYPCVYLQDYSFLEDLESTIPNYRRWQEAGSELKLKDIFNNMITPNGTMDPRDIETFFIHLTLIKHQSWDYEKERRLVLGSIGIKQVKKVFDTGYQVPWNENSLKRIIVGQNASIETKTFLMQMACLHHVPLMITECTNPMSFGIDIKAQPLFVPCSINLLVYY